MNVLVVMIAGFFGAISRYSLGEWLHTNNGFPIGTLSVNLVGCFLLAWLLTAVSHNKHINPQITLFIGTGFIGSFTTFSTLSVETIQLIQNGFMWVAILYVGTSIFFGILLAFAGYKLALIRKVGETN